jgi:hypothetical protein
MIYFMSLRKFLNLAICCYNILVMEFLGCYMNWHSHKMCPAEMRIAAGRGLCSARCGWS